MITEEGNNRKRNAACLGTGTYEEKMNGECKRTGKQLN